MVDENNSSNGLILGIPREMDAEETRVALTPDLLRRLSKLGINVVIESGAGHKAGHPDQEYLDGGARIAGSPEELWSQADVVALVNGASPDQIARMKRGAILLGMLRPATDRPLVDACVANGVSAMSYDFVPRITRAQSVDALSAMTNVAGYKAVLLAATHLKKMLPMMMTAAGTVTPSKVFVIGAGVAGLQAIATAKRLGAVVEAYDVRPAVKEQVESLGARFIEFQIESKVGEGGYAGDQSADEQRQQREQMTAVVADADVVITTALIPGRPAPKLVSEDMVKAMAPGSVIVDMAAETGGNCDVTVPGEVATVHDITIVGLTNLAASIPLHASRMLGQIATTLLMWTVKDGVLTLDFEDEVIDGMTVIHDGQIRSERLNEALSKQGATA